jgi:hypothetical protein
MQKDKGLVETLKSYVYRSYSVNASTVGAAARSIYKLLGRGGVWLLT